MQDNGFSWSRLFESSNHNCRDIVRLVVLEIKSLVTITFTIYIILLLIIILKLANNTIC